MSKNDHKAILDGIHSDKPVLNINAIICGTNLRLTDLEFINGVKKLIDSKETFFGTELGNYAIASLHVLGIQDYLGDDVTIMNLIESKFKIG